MNGGLCTDEVSPASSRILLLDLACQKDHLSRYEFVHPVRDALLKAGQTCSTMHYTSVSDAVLEEHDRIILCGTALMDNGFAQNISAFSWLEDFDRPVLGICAGMQAISAVFGGNIIRQPAIGLEEIEIVRDSPLLGPPRVIEGYMLHNYAATLPEDFVLLAGRAKAAQAFLHSTRPLYGIIFHPEVRNRWILERFASYRKGFSYETDLCNESSL